MRPQWQEQNRERVRAAVDYRGYFRERVREIKPAGQDQVVGLCPFHGDTKHSLSVNTTSGLWNCKGCGESGDIFSFHAKFHSLGGFKEAMLDLARLYGVTLERGPAGGQGKKPGVDSSGPKQEPKRQAELDPGLVEKYHQALLANQAGLDWLAKERLISLDSVKRFRLGNKLDEKRLIIPVFDAGGRLLNLRRYSPHAEQKMLNWPGFGGAAIYGLPELAALPLDEEVIICEGELDRLVLVQAGFNAMTHTNGALSFQKDWAELFKGRRVVLVYDADKGGLQGAEKTAAILGPVVESLKVVDLKAAGLVEGTPQSKDITNLARKAPGWPQALRSAIEAAPTFSPGFNAFVRVVEKGGVYWKIKKDGLEEPISNFTLAPTRRIKVERQEVLEALVCMNGHGRSEVTLWPHHWASKVAFKKALGDLGAGWVGAEDEIQQIKVLTAEKPCPKYRGESKLGLHLRDGRWVLVASNRTLTATGEIEDLIFWSENSTRIGYEPDKIKPADAGETKQVVEALLDFNEPSVVAPILGWMGAVPFKARLVEAVPQLRRQFPILLLWGERGAGKTKTVEMVLLPFFGDHEGPRKVDEMTRFTFMLNAHSTNLVPLAFDEYKPSKLNPRQISEVSGFCRSCYNALTGERGQAGPEGLTSKVYTYTAPVILLGEQTLFEPALKERIIEVICTRTGREGRRHIQEFMLLNLAGAGLKYLRWSLGLPDQEIAAIWKDEFKAADAAFEDRIRQNVATVRMGLRLWQRHLIAEGVEINIDPLLAAVDQGQKAALIGEGPRPKSDIDLIIEGIGAMAAMAGKELVKQDEDFRVVDDRLLLRLQTLYPKFRKWAREYSFDGEVLDESSLKRRLKGEPYFIGKTTMNVFEGSQYGAPKKTVKVYALDVGKLDAAGVDLTGFGLEETPF
ncbi:MAG: toprim domain-containing protein [Desulforudis sp.]|nr:MAG: toprim domain-containing protein [Desulforudis sp.]